MRRRDHMLVGLRRGDLCSDDRSVRVTSYATFWIAGTGIDRSYTNRTRY